MTDSRDDLPLVVVKRNDDHDVSNDYIKVKRTTRIGAGVASVGVVAALVTYSQVKAVFYGRDEGVSIERRVTVVETAVKEQGEQNAQAIQRLDEKGQQRSDKLREEFRTELANAQNQTAARLTEVQNQTNARLTEVSNRIIEVMRTNKIETEERIKELRDSIRKGK